MPDMLNLTAADIQLTETEEIEAENVLRLHREIEEQGLAGQIAANYWIEGLKKIWPWYPGGYDNWLYVPSLYHLLRIQKRLKVIDEPPWHALVD